LSATPDSPGTDRWGPASASFDALGVWSSPEALAVFKRLAGCLREAGDSNGDTGPARQLWQFALGRPVPTIELAPWLSPADFQVLENSGSIEIEDDEATPRFAFFPEGDLLALIPRPTCFDEVAYLGPDSRWLVEVAADLGTGGERAADLGTGSGFVAAALSLRYRFTMGTDLKLWTAAVAAITLALNLRPGARAAVCATDVAGGLRPGSFDLVTANPPWVPTRDETRPRRLFADGGPTGFELPRRFILEGSGLIAPGGIGIFLCVDVHYTGGGKTPLDGLVRELELDGCRVEVRQAPAEERWPDRTEALRALNPDLEQARLVAVVVRR